METNSPRAGLSARCDSLAPQVRHRLILALASGLLWWWTAGLWDLTGPDETRYVMVGRELLSRTNWFLLTINGLPYDQKPPLPFWMFAGMVWLGGGGVVTWLVRLPSVVFATLMVQMTYSIGLRRIGARGGFIAGLILMTSPLFFKQAVTARIDLLFAGWITAAFWVWLARADERERMSPARAASFWLFLAGAFFTKGPLALIIVLGSQLCCCGVARSWGPWRITRPAVGLPLLLASICGWFYVQTVSVNGGFVLEQIREQTLGRVRTEEHKNPVYYYIEVMFGGVFMPWTPLLLAAFVQLWRGRRGAVAGPSAPILCWIILPLVLLHFATGKRQFYLLPLLPAMALVTAWFMEGRMLDLEPRPWMRRLASGIMVVAGMAAAGFAVFALARHDLLWGVRFYILPSHCAALLVLAAAFLALSRLVLRAARFERLVHATAAVMMGVALAYFTAIVPAMNPKNSTRQFAASVDAMFDPADPRIAAYDDAARPLYHVYGRYRVDAHDKPKNEQLDPGRMPRIAVLELEEEPQAETTLRAAGLFRADAQLVDGDELVIYRRAGEPLPPADAPLEFGLSPGTLRGEIAPAGSGKDSNRGPRFHSRTFGDERITFFVADADTLATDPVQMAWLRGSLGLCRSQWKILLLDRPVRSRLLDRILAEGGGPDLTLYESDGPPAAGGGIGSICHIGAAGGANRAWLRIEGNLLRAHPVDPTRRGETLFELNRPPRRDAWNEERRGKDKKSRGKS